ncbi:MAG TPA: MAPEG family protein, partial [Caldimonas sp.]
LLFVVLSVRTLLLRRTLGIAIGDAGNESMLRAMRVHGNFAEYVPLSLLLMYLVEVTGASPLYVHALGFAVIAGRVSHAIGVSRLKENYAFRIVGITLTLAPLVAASLRLLRVFLAQNVA